MNLLHTRYNRLHLALLLRASTSVHHLRRRHRFLVHACFTHAFPMVGVPGRSAGCRTCRKRKKKVSNICTKGHCKSMRQLHCMLTWRKCDLQRPLCGNCTRGNFVCGGYGRDMIMIQVDKHGKGTYQVQQPQETKSQSIKQVAVIPSFADVRCKDLNRTTSELE